MALDGIILSKIREDIEEYLPIRINRVLELSKNVIVFNIHGNNTRSNLIMSFHSVYNHISISNKSYSSYNEPNNFVMVLRKYIQNGFIYKIEQFSYDRYLLMHIRNRDELYDDKEYILSVELMGKYANLILVDKENNKIIDALKKIPPYENNKRTILSGADFVLPEGQNKIDPFSINEINLDESLVKQYQGFSKLLENEIRYRLNDSSYQEIINEIKESKKIYLARNNDEFEYHIIPLKHLNLNFEEYSIEDGLDEIFYNRDEKDRVKNVAEDLFKIVKRQIKHLNNKIVKLNNSLNDALNLEEDKIKGDLLYTYSSLDTKGLNEIEIDDYEGNKKRISLDPKLSIKANANKYYQAYQKKRKGKTYIDEQIDIANKQLEYFNSLQEQLDFANYQDSLVIKEELIKNGYLKANKQKQKQKKKRIINLYRIELEDDIQITFGKNNLQNDYLTFDFAKGDYMWFHAKDYHGGHVVINTSEPDEKMIRICANLAAYYSKGRYSSSVPVNYTLVRNLKKVKGMPSGFVTMKTYKTIYIDPIEDKSLNIISI